MNWLHACYCFGAMLGPLFMTAVLASGRHYSIGYVAAGGVVVSLSAVFLATFPKWEPASAIRDVHGVRGGALAALRHTAVLLQVAVFFVYTGLEMTLSQWAFTVLTDSRGMHSGPAGIAAGSYWGSIGLGRVAFGLVADKIGIDRLLRYSLLAAAGGVVLFAAQGPPVASIAGLVLAGLGLAPVFPCLMARTPQRLGRNLSTHAVGFQVGAAMIGAAAVPGCLGLVAGVGGLEAVPVGAVVLAGVLWLLHERLRRRADIG
jgi:fucose permease